LLWCKYSSGKCSRTGRVEEEFFNLENGLGEHVIREVVGRIFDSIGKPFLRLSVRDSVEWDIRGA
jgi:hypothetical protein